MFNNIHFTCMLVVFYGICSSLGQTLPDEPLYTDNACYGSSSGSYFHSNCSTNHAIAVSKVMGGAKPYTTGCPSVDDGNNPSNFSVCCMFSSGDCIEEFSGALKTYHDGCSGEEVCKLGTGATRYRFVNCQEPLVNNSFNSYMKLNYHCIDKATIGSTCTPVSMTTSSKALYLWNNGYPSTATAGCNCSIEINSSTARIEVMALRIELFGNSNNCIRFLDGVCNTRETVLCSNQSAITVIYTSTSNYLLMEYRRGQINDSGRYWIRFKATNSSADLIVKCQPESKPVCTTTTSTTTTPSTTTSTTTMKTSTVTSTNTPKTNGTTLNTTGLVIPSTTAQEKPSMGVIIGVVVGVVCLILLIVVIVIIYMRKIKPARDRKEVSITLFITTAGLIKESLLYTLLVIALYLLISGRHIR
ncbi:hypothetical protein CHS0354_030041 [Potamilus streckersoni]|uniref:Uncharacterized protein n=1 Tax=Potamilus streckersoni TaxID=2493646 RepID=A0AAE0WFC6_9BIVA|nr:hypothetical protein CHS0354_030041 [Potamilus streckersoni]